MVSGTDEHGTPVMVAADKEGRSPRETADQFSALIREDLRDLGLSYDLLHAHDDAEPLPRHAGPVPDAVREGLPASSARRSGRSPPDRPHAAGPLHRGDVPDLRLRRRARRPVRQLRQPARPDRPDRAALARSTARRRSSGRRSTSSSTCRPSRSACASGSTAQTHWRTERAQLLAQLRRRSEAASGHARPRLGRSDPGAGLRGEPEQADLRLVRRGDRLPLGRGRMGESRGTAGRLARVVAEPRRAPLLLHGQGQHRLPHRDLAEHLLGYGEGGELGAGAARSSCRTTSSRASS